MRNSKIYYTAFIIIFSSLVIAGCKKQLDQVPETSITDANYWRSVNDLGLAANYLYGFLPGFDVPAQDQYSEMAYAGAGSFNQVSDGSRLTPATSGEWNNYYRLIRAANNILEKSVTVTGDQSVINKYLGETRFFRAWGYFELVKRFGDVPYINRTLTLDDTLLYAGRTPREQIIDSIYADLDFAAATCPMPDAQSAAEYGRITATASNAFKSRVALFEGTWNKFHGGGDFARHLQIAVNTAGDIMSSAKHGLFTHSTIPDSSYYYLFQYQNNLVQQNYSYTTNKEPILLRIYGQNASNNISSHNYVRGTLANNFNNPTRALVNAYLYKDGLPAGMSVYDSSLQETSPYTQYANRDPRIGMTFATPGTPYPSITGIQSYFPGIFYNTLKYFTILDYTASQSFVNLMIIRYAEVLLNYAEAKYELDGSLSNSDLDATINLIRNRASNNNTASLPVLSNEFVTTNGLEMRTEIRREREVELSIEGFHYWDILRWKTAETVLPVTLLGPKYFPSMGNVGNGRFDSNGFLIIQDGAQRKFDAQRDYLWPLPTQEIGLNARLTQNPGWQ